MQSLIFCYCLRNNQQLLTFLSVLNETIRKSKSLSNANYAIKLDNSILIDNLMNSLNNELNILLNNNDDDNNESLFQFLKSESTIPADDAIIDLVSL
jgi:hypothetical protein